MKKLNTDLLTSICEVAGAPGFEQRVRDLSLMKLKTSLMNTELII